MTLPMHTLDTIKLAVIGLGYVGLPLAVEFARKRHVVGFDINQPRIDALSAGHDATLDPAGPNSDCPNWVATHAYTTLNAL